MQYTVMHTAAVRYVILQIRDGHYLTTHKGTNMYTITAKQLDKIIRGMTMAEMYLADHIGDSDQQQYESDEIDVQEALATIDRIIGSNK